MLGPEAARALFEWAGLVVVVVVVAVGGVAFTDLCAPSEEVCVTVFSIAAEESGAVNAALDASA